MARKRPNSEWIAKPFEWINFEVGSATAATSGPLADVDTEFQPMPSSATTVKALSFTRSP